MVGTECHARGNVFRPVRQGFKCQCAWWRKAEPIRNGMSGNVPQWKCPTPARRGGIVSSNGLGTAARPRHERGGARHREYSPIKPPQSGTTQDWG